MSLHIPLIDRYWLDANRASDEFVPLAYRYSRQATSPLHAASLCYVDEIASFAAANPSRWPVPLDANNNYTGLIFNGFVDRFNGMGGMPFDNDANSPTFRCYCTPQSSPGCVVSDEAFAPEGIAEAPSVSNIYQRTYVLYSRNQWISPAYGVYYRVFERAQSQPCQKHTFKECGLAGWNTPDPSLGSCQPAEQTLLTSDHTGTVPSRSFAVGRIFWGPAPDPSGPGICANSPQRPYLLFAARKPAPNSRKFVFFKELYIKPNGTFQTISDNQSSPGACSPIDPNVFLIPWDGPACWGQIGDFNNTGCKTAQDIFDFLAAYFAGLPSADVNGNGSVSVQDVFTFLGDWYIECWAPPQTDWLLPSNDDMDPGESTDIPPEEWEQAIQVPPGRGREVGASVAVDATPGDNQHLTDPSGPQLAMVIDAAQRLAATLSPGPVREQLLSAIADSDATVESLLAAIALAMGAPSPQ